MAKLDPFSAQLVAFVRNMPDEAILELVRNQLQAVPIGRVAAATPRKSPVKKRAKRQSSADREQLLALIERAVKSAKGLSASQIAEKTRIAKTRVQSALRKLKHSGRIHQGGDRRFARYAGNAKAAKAASMQARKNASKPQRAKKKATKRRKKK